MIVFTSTAASSQPSSAAAPVEWPEVLHAALTAEHVYHAWVHTLISSINGKLLLQKEQQGRGQQQSGQKQKWQQEGSRVTDNPYSIAIIIRQAVMQVEMHAAACTISQSPHQCCVQCTVHPDALRLVLPPTLAASLPAAVSHTLYHAQRISQFLAASRLKALSSWRAMLAARGVRLRSSPSFSRNATSCTTQQQQQQQHQQHLHV
jgi:hypothetical protein